MPHKDQEAKKAYHKAYYARHRVEQLASQKAKRDADPGKQAKYRAYYAANRERLMLNARKSVLKRHEHYKKYWREFSRQKRLGISAEDFAALEASQNGACAICKMPFKDLKTNNIHLDHCHKTNKVRGILCRFCNYALGYAADSPERLVGMVLYLAEHSENKP